MEYVAKTTGTVVECGSGQYSTPYLHWMCFPNRKLVTLETDALYAERFGVYETDWHTIRLIENWDIFPPECSVVLIDSAPAESRTKLVKLFADTAEYLIVHDTERNLVITPFKYAKTFNAVKPWTTVLSNKHPL